MPDLDDLATELISEYKKLEIEKSKFEVLKSNFLSELQRQNVGAVDIKEGKVTVCTRTSKDYGQTIKNLEANLKAEKTRLDHLGEFVIKNVTHYLRVG
jgi:hypothetical protein